MNLMSLRLKYFSGCKRTRVHSHFICVIVLLMYLYIRLKCIRCCKNTQIIHWYKIKGENTNGLIVKCSNM